MVIRKQQTKVFILATALGCGCLIAFIKLVMMPIRTEWKQNSSIATEAEAELIETRKVISSRRSIQQQIEKTSRIIQQKSDSIPLPILGNYLLVMREAIYECARNPDIKINDIIDCGKVKFRDGNGIFNIYQVQVILQAGFHDLTEFIKAIEASNPMVSVSNLNIVPRRDSPEYHAISLVLSWLVWSDPTERPVFLQAEDE